VLGGKRNPGFKEITQIEGRIGVEVGIKLKSGVRKAGACAAPTGASVQRYGCPHSGEGPGVRTERLGGAVST